MAATDSIRLPGPTPACPAVDGPLKVSGGAMYTSDHNLPGMLYAVPVCATIANGTSSRSTRTAAQQMPGVKAVYHRGNIGKLFRTAPLGLASLPIVDEKRPPFEDDIIRYYGQYVAAVVADTYRAGGGRRRSREGHLQDTEKPDVAAHLESR